MNPLNWFRKKPAPKTEPKPEPSNQPPQPPQSDAVWDAWQKQNPGGGRAAARQANARPSDNLQ